MGSNYQNEFPIEVQEYLNYLSGVQNKSKLTIEEYASDLRTFLRFMLVSKGKVSSDFPFDEIKIDAIDIDFFTSIRLFDAYSFLTYCKDVRGNNATTRSRKVSVLRGFFRFLTVQKHILDENPMQELDKPKTTKSLPKYLTLEESLTLLNNIDGPYKERDYCIITFFLNCGLRLSELVGLNLDSINHDNNTMRVLGKGSKERIIYLNDACINALENYLKVRPVDHVKDKNALFLSRFLKRISPKTVQHMIYQNLEKSGLSGRGLSVHKLRHTAATLMYQHGDVDVLVLKEMLGHENLSTTEIYTHVVDKQLEEAAKNNPLAQVKIKDKKDHT